MWADPKPEDAIVGRIAEHTIVKADTRGPIRSYSFEVQRRMKWIAYEQFEVATCELLDIDRQRLELGPKRGRSVMLQQSFVLSPRR